MAHHTLPLIFTLESSVLGRDVLLPLRDNLLAYWETVEPPLSDV